MGSGTTPLPLKYLYTTSLMEDKVSTSRSLQPNLRYIFLPMQTCFPMTTVNLSSPFFTSREWQAAGPKQSMTRQVFEGACMKYAPFTQNCKAMFFNIEKKAKAEKAIRALKQTKSMVMYTHKFDLHSHYIKWDTPTWMSQYIQGSKKNLWLSVLVPQAELTNLAALSNFPKSLDNTLNSNNNTPTTYNPVSDPDAM